ncbi:peptidoglycan/LPS O-acetylase OafA/YrhL [Angulomicrobium tetraedrale]|uniref:Peptidoglycan/LPS O-acetylase OafA/YrhL n=1 Tax=Ancylobacter tetraedralis TaxID=217068 RepID=A0A839Z5C1_9HYPH|nr:acyltransferase family protein [Ancylobacter tetraedralis]MBB3770849.1 peptidoglycan/LPS O-acetylase OafA/YrhL [Ancylobacter tetraedralis]
MKYRSEIDGLRAVAVLPVILFHAGVGVFSGGFVGVDIFFVISGYLITSLLVADLERGQFSLLTFYERRARRICPALFLVMAACLPFAWVWMGPLELRDFGRSIVSVVFFVSNFVFWREDGYFSAPAELKPLLHTWSLAVEEQYYLFAPVCLFLLWRFGKKALFWATVATALASLALTEWGWRHAPSANFYLTPFRVWELLAGSLCAMRMTWRAPRGNDALGAAGLALILFSIFGFDGKTPFPSLYALAPVGGAALIILYARQGTWTARLLSLPPLVGIGLISYSAYLWHQPLFAFARIRALAAPPEELLLGLAVLSLGLAYLSWRFVEQPFRRGPRPWLPGRRVLVASCAVGTLFVALGLYGNLSGGLPERFPIPAPGSREAMLLDTLKGNELGQDCWPDGLKPGAPRKAILCPIFTPENPKRRILIIGDSHAHILLPAFAQIGKTDAVSWMGLASCPPFLGVTVRGAAFGAGVCEPFARQQYETVKAGGYDMVVLVSAWSYYLNSLSEGPADSASMLPPEAGPADAGGAIDGAANGSKAVFARFIPRTVRAYADLGITVVLIDQMPEQPAFPQKVLRQAVYLGRSGGVSPEQFEQAVRETSQSVAADTAAHGFATAVLSRLAGANVWVLSFKDLFQQNGVYLWGDRNGSYYFDNNHLSLYGARFVENSLTAAFTRIEQATARN